MRFISVEKSAVVLNYMWLPTWLGQNLQFKRDLEKELRAKIVGRSIDQRTLDEIHGLIIEYICTKFPLPGLRDYLDGIKFLEESSGG
jgi:hypothetical protein